VRDEIGRLVLVPARNSPIRPITRLLACYPIPDVQTALERAILDAARTKQTGVSMLTLLQFGKQVRSHVGKHLTSCSSDGHTFAVRMVTRCPHLVAACPIQPLRLRSGVVQASEAGLSETLTQSATFLKRELP